MYHNFFDQKGVNKMAQRKFIIDGGFKTDDASELLANLTMGGSILPDVDSDGTTGYDLGSTTAKWKDLYLSQGSLYINNQKVLQDDSGTIVVSADNDQGMTVKTTCLCVFCWKHWGEPVMIFFPIIVFFPAFFIFWRIWSV